MATQKLTDLIKDEAAIEPTAPIPATPVVRAVNSTTSTIEQLQQYAIVWYESTRPSTLMLMGSGLLGSWIVFEYFLPFFHLLIAGAWSIAGAGAIGVGAYQAYQAWKSPVE